MSEKNLSDISLRDLTVRHVKAGYPSVYQYAIALEARLEEPARCNSGHETLPLKLWTCPTCHEELERKLERMERLREYTHHIYSTCTSASGKPLKCLCGLDAALAAAQQEESDD